MWPCPAEVWVSPGPTPTDDDLPVEMRAAAPTADPSPSAAVTEPTTVQTGVLSPNPPTGGQADESEPAHQRAGDVPAVMANGDAKPEGAPTIDDALVALAPPETATFWRANAVRNKMQYWKTALLRPDAPHELKQEALRGIDRAWAAIQGHDVETWNKVTLMRAVDSVARANTATGTAAGEAVLGELPPELVALLDPHREALGTLVGAWRRKRAGNCGQSKWAQCAALWKAATGVETTDDVWKTLWKDVARPRIEWDWVRLMQAVNAVAQANGAAGISADEAVLGKLPPESVALLNPHRELVGALVEAWQKAAPDGEPTPHAFLACVKLWKAATGVATTADRWETLWKDVARPRK